MDAMNPIHILLVILLVLLLVGGLPQWGWHAYGALPSGAVGLLLIIVLVLILLRI